MDSPNPDSGEEYFHTNTQLFNTLDDHNRFKIGEAAAAPWNAPPAGATPTMDGFVTDYISTFTGEIGRQPTYDEYAHIMLIACKALACGLSLSAFRGGPVFPSMFIGAAIGIAASGLPGMDLAPAIGMGIGAMCTAMLRLPLTSTLLAILLLGADGLSVTPEIIVAVVVAYVVTNTLPVPGPKEPTVPPAGTRPLGAPPPAPAPA